MYSHCKNITYQCIISLANNYCTWGKVSLIKHSTSPWCNIRARSRCKLHTTHPLPPTRLTIAASNSILIMSSESEYSDAHQEDIFDDQADADVLDEETEYESSGLLRRLT